jgi:hypothetical protein
MDIKPGSCPSPFNQNRWDFADSGNPRKGGVMKVAVLGSGSVDCFSIDQNSIMMGAATPLSYAFADVAAGPGFENVGGCPGRKDGRLDLEMQFDEQAVAAGSGPKPDVGDVVMLTLRGNYIDGMPFEANGFVTIVGKDSKLEPSGGPGAVLGYPNPNPFNPVTRISYSVATTQHVSIMIYDVAGRLVENLVNEVKSAGEYVVEWDAGTLPSGVYFHRMQTGSQTVVRRATLLK